ncbi:hypothetical protein BC939DRAFT_81461 [Gamsiella multidivaricata]|uniref:uncharacterized protein n=1 Tax=Gamsiella multidivaricata TaxID=101098 RepID=UPI00221FDC43|nr:uncharacterized protein BC939DRAFT_81461 [Gamsiella multidivaricata]KAI7815844.1 hypothetical protein BC939DRAFT_81461 [Gamsiella multidivaricata]
MSAAATSSLGPQGHLGLLTGSARPRARSVNTDHTQFQFQHQHQQQQQHQHQSHNQNQRQSTSNEAEVVSPSSAALDQIKSSLTMTTHHTGSHSAHQHYVLSSQPAQPLQPSSISSSPIRPSFASASADSHPYSLQQDSILNMSSNSASSTPPATKTSFGLSIPNNSGSNLNHYSGSSSSIYNNTVISHAGSSPNPVLANSTSSLSTLTGNSPLQHRPHTPLKSSFPLSITSEHPSDTMTIPPLSSSSSPSAYHAGISGGAGAAGAAGGRGGGGGGGGEGGGGGADIVPPSSASSSLPGGSFENTSIVPGPFHFKSLSTGRMHNMGNEKNLGSLPTIQHQNGRRRRKFLVFDGFSHQVMI